MGRRAAGLALFVTLAVVLAAEARAAASPRELWSQSASALEQGDMERAGERLDQLLTTGRSLGIRRFPLYARSASAFARQAQDAGNTTLAQWSIGAAESLDPISPAVDFAAADVAVARGDWGDATTRLFAGAGNVFNDYISRVLARADLTIVAWTAIALAAIIFAVILFFRYARPASHDLRELMSDRFAAGTATVLAFALLFLPLFLWLGLVWLVLFWLVFFFAYATLRERALIGLMLILLAMLPVALDWNAYVIAGANSPIVRAAADGMERSYNPEVVQRLSELTDALPEEPYLHLLLGNLELQYGNEQQASLHYRRAIELNDNLSGAHLNIGNVHFLNNDFSAAINEYLKAQQIEPDMAIAYYNHSVAAGEQYNFDVQGQQLEAAREHDRSLVERLLANPPRQKVARYNVPMPVAWELQERISQRPEAEEIFGSYARFSVADSMMNSLTIGALAALLLAVLLWQLVRRRGLAGACIKCGRTFCPRCKSSRESATYCTQCIHIYLKRDGVAVNAKRHKMAEVQTYQTKSLRLKKLLATFLPGSAQILDGATVRGLIALVLFLAFVIVAIAIDRLAPVAAPADIMRMAVRAGAVLLALVAWIVVSVPVYKQKQTG